MDFEFPRHPLCVRPESNSILISIFELILILIMSFVFSRDDAVSNTVSRPVAGKLALAPHPVQKWRQLHVNQKCRCDMWLSPEVEITLVTHWDRPLGNSHQGCEPAKHSKAGRPSVSQSSFWITGDHGWAKDCVELGVHELCLAIIIDISFFQVSIFHTQIRKNTSSDESLSFIPLRA